MMALQVLNKKKGRFTKDNLNLVDSIATQAAVSIQNAQNNEFFEKNFDDLRNKRYSEKDLKILIEDINKFILENEFIFINANYETLVLDGNKIDVLIKFEDLKIEYKKFKMHIDGIQEITIVDDYKVELNKI